MRAIERWDHSSRSPKAPQESSRDTIGATVAAHKRMTDCTIYGAIQVSVKRRYRNILGRFICTESYIFLYAREQIAGTLDQSLFGEVRAL
jgi:hypothetical protein